MAIKLKVLIVEDESITRKMMIDYVNSDPRLEFVDSAIDGKSAVGLLSIKTYDLVFMDINLPVMSGFEVLTSISSTPFVVFTTVYSHYAVQAFEVGALDYIVKPVSRERFELSVGKAVSYIERIQPNAHATAADGEKKAGMPLFNVLIGEFGLTYQEATIACHLFDNNSRTAISKLLCIKQTTLKNHLKTIYGKTIDLNINQPSHTRDKQARLMLFLSHLIENNA